MAKVPEMVPVVKKNPKKKQNVWKRIKQEKEKGDKEMERENKIRGGYRK